MIAIEVLHFRRG